jgi:hypothetical protein
VRDAADAAAMSNPDRDPHFRRRWLEVCAPTGPTHPDVGAVGALSLALREALNRRKKAEQAQEVASNNSDPPQ